jgi:WD40 repeat protein
VVTGKELRRWNGPKDPMFSMAFSPDGQWLAAATEKTVRVWWTKTGELFRTFNYLEALAGSGVRVGHLVFSSDGNWLHAEGDGGDVIWDVLAGNRVKAASFYGYSGRSFIGDSPIHTMQEEWRRHPYLLDIFRDHAIAPLPAWAREEIVALSRDRTMFAAPGKDGTILVARTADLPDKPKQVAIPAQQISDLWSDLGARDKDGYKAFNAFKKLTDGDKDVVAFLAKKLSPAKGPDARQLAKWLADLDSNDAKVRAAARKELEAWGPSVEMSLRNAYEGMGKEGRSESKSLLDKIEKKLVEEESLQTLKAIAVLAARGTPETRELLSRLATGAPGSRITESARLALPRTAK